MQITHNDLDHHTAIGSRKPARTSRVYELGNDRARRSRSDGRYGKLEYEDLRDEEHRNTGSPETREHAGSRKDEHSVYEKVG